MKRAGIVTLALGLTSLAFSVLFAVSPANRFESLIEWSAPTSASSTSTPLALTNPTPRAISVAAPCGVPFDLSTAEFNGLVIASDGTKLSASVGTTDLFDQTVSEACELEFLSSDDSYSLLLNGKPVVAGSLPVEIRVTQIHQTGSADVNVEILTEAHGTTPSNRQLRLLGIALAAFTGASYSGLRLLASNSRTPDPTRRRLPVGIFDAIAIGVILTWAVLGPPFVDDGFVQARILAYPDVGELSVYYTANAVEQPLGYWYEMLQLPLVTAAPDLVFQRLLVVGILILGWLSIRLALRELRLGDTNWRLGIASVVYCLGVVGWLMTLRPEPVVALLAGANLVLALRFQREKRSWLLVLSGVVAVLAVTAHTTGVVAFAPILAITPSIVRWLRDLNSEQKRAALGLASGIAALGTILLFLDSDLAGKTASVSGYDETGFYDGGILTELSRYARLSSIPYSSAVRRGFIGCIGIALFLWVFRRISGKETSNVPAVALGIGLMLLTLTPSKWPWHFGALVVLTCVSIAAELPASHTKLKSPRVLLMLGIIALFAGWAWEGRNDLHLYDLRTLNWGVGSPVDGFPLDMSSLYLWIGVAATIAISAKLRPNLLHNPVGMSIAIVAMSAVLATAAVIAADSIATDSWTFAKQNISALAGDSECGLGDETYAPEPGSLAHLQTAPMAGESNAPNARSERDTNKESTQSLGNVLNGPAISPWYEARSDLSWIAVPILGGSDASLSLEVAELDSGSLVATHSRQLIVRGDPTEWTLVVSRLDVGKGTQLRVVTEEDEVQFGEPHELTMSPIEDLVWTPSNGLLVHPYLRPYFPCTVQPSIANGLAAPPAVVIGGWNLMEVFKRSEDTIDYLPLQGPGQTPYMEVSMDYLTNTSREGILVSVRSRSGGSEEASLDDF